MQLIEPPIHFLPHTKKGTIILGLLILFTLGVGISFFWLSSTTSTGVIFAVYLALGVLFCLPLPMLGYRFYALNRAYYDFDRNLLTIHWGLRTEMIPLKEIQWVRPVSDLVLPLPFPKLHLPGALLGIRADRWSREG